MNDVTFGFAAVSDTQKIQELLTASGLPDEDIAPHLSNFIVAKAGDRLAGCIGLEISGENGLLRSLAVHDAYRSKGLGTELCRRLKEHAREIGFQDLYLLTTSAEYYFQQNGWMKVPRSDAPQTIKETKQFTALCPSTAVLMFSSL